MATETRNLDKKEESELSNIIVRVSKISTLASENAQNDFQYVPFCSPIWRVSHCNMHRFATQNGIRCNWKRPTALHTSSLY